MRLWIVVACLAAVSVACSGAADRSLQPTGDVGDRAASVDVSETPAEDRFNPGNGTVPKGLPMPVAPDGEVVLSSSLTDQVSVHLWYDIARWDELVTMYEVWLADQTVEDMVELRGDTKVSWFGDIGDGSFSITVAQGPHPTEGTATSVILSWITG